MSLSIAFILICLFLHIILYEFCVCGLDIVVIETTGAFTWKLALVTIFGANSFKRDTFNGFERGDFKGLNVFINKGLNEIYI